MNRDLWLNLTMESSENITCTRWWEKCLPWVCFCHLDILIFSFTGTHSALILRFTCSSFITRETIFFLTENMLFLNKVTHKISTFMWIFWWRCENEYSGLVSGDTVTTYHLTSQLIIKNYFFTILGGCNCQSMFQVGLKCLPLAGIWLSSLSVISLVSVCVCVLISCFL